MLQDLPDPCLLTVTVCWCSAVQCSYKRQRLFSAARAHSHLYLGSCAGAAQQQVRSHDRPANNSCGSSSSNSKCWTLHTIAAGSNTGRQGWRLLFVEVLCWRLFQSPAGSAACVAGAVGGGLSGVCCTDISHNGTAGIWSSAVLDSTVLHATACISLSS